MTTPGSARVETSRVEIIASMYYDKFLVMRFKGLDNFHIFVSKSHDYGFLILMISRG